MTQYQVGKRLLTAFFLVASTSALAQQQPGQPGPNGNYPGVGIPDNLSVNISLVDRSFISDTLKHDQEQIQISQLAEKKSTSDDVKQFSQNMVQSRTQLNDQLRPIAKQLNISEPDKPSKQDKQELANLQALSGPAFDAAYLQAMAKEQEHSLKEFKEEEQGTKSDVLQRTAKEDQLTLVQNYEVLQRLAAAHSVAVGGK